MAKKEFGEHTFCIAPFVFSFGIGWDYTPGQCEKWIRVSRPRPGTNIDQSGHVIPNHVRDDERDASNGCGKKRFSIRQEYRGWHAEFSKSELNYYAAAFPVFFDFEPDLLYTALTRVQ